MLDPVERPESAVEPEAPDAPGGNGAVPAADVDERIESVSGPVIGADPEVDSTEPDTVDPDAPDPAAADSDATDPDSAGSDTTEPGTAEADTAEPDTAEPDTARLGSAEPGSPEPDTVDRDDESVASAAARPAGKRRSTGSRVPDRLTDTERPKGATATSAASARSGRSAPSMARGLNLAIAMVVVAIVLGGLAIWFKGEADSLAAGTDAANAAFTDSVATSEAKGQLTSAVERTLSYNFADIDASAVAVREKLTGKAKCEYDFLFGKHKQEATAQKQVVTTKVRQLGVNRLQGDQAFVLVFVDQTSTRTDKNETTGSRAQFGVRAERVDGAWKIASFDMLGQPLPGGATLPNCS